MKKAKFILLFYLILLRN